MKSAFDQRLRSVRWRCHGNLLLENLAWCLAAAGAAATLAAAADRLFSLHALRGWQLGLAGGAAALAAAGLWYRRRPSLLAVAVRIDQELGLKERMSTALAMAQSPDPFAAAARAEAHQAAERVDLKGKFGVRLSRRWLWPTAAWLAAAAVLVLVPPMDLLGREQRAKEQEKAARQIQQARVEVQQAMEKVSLAVQQINDPTLANELAQAGDARDARPDDVRREAVRKLGELADKIKKAENSPKMEAVKDLREMLKSVRTPPGSFSPELNRAIARGDFKQAGEFLRDAQKKLEEGKLTDEQKKALARQLAQLGKQLEDQANRNKEMQEELEKNGLDKDLAELSPEDLRKALEDKGLSQEQIEELMKKAEACRQACSQCRNLGKGLRMAAGLGAGGLPDEDGELSPEELAELLEKIEDLQQASDQLAGCAGSRQAIEDAIARLGGQGPWSAGLALNAGAGTGGPGTGLGPRNSDTTGNTALDKTKVEGPTKDGPVVASWYFKGQQIKGESKRELQDVVHAARDAAADAINDNEIPRRYESSIKKYFGDLEETGRPPGNR